MKTIVLCMFQPMLNGVVSVLKSTFYKFLWLESTWENLHHSLSTLLTSLRTTYISLFSSLISDYTHYRIPLPVPFVYIYIYSPFITIFHSKYFILQQAIELQDYSNGKIYFS